MVAFVLDTGIIPSAINITSAVSSSKSRNAWYLYRRPTLFQSHRSTHTSSCDLNQQHLPQDSSEWRTGLRRDRLYPVHTRFPPLHEWQALQCSSVHSSVRVCCSILCASTRDSTLSSSSICHLTCSCDLLSDRAKMTGGLLSRAQVILTSMCEPTSGKGTWPRGLEAAVAGPGRSAVLARLTLFVSPAAHGNAGVVCVSIITSASMYGALSAAGLLLHKRSS